MITTTATKTPRTLIAAGTSVAAGTPQRAAVDLRTKHGGVLTVKLTNGATGPTAQAVATLMIAHDAGTLPATGAAGAVWKTLQVLGGGGTTANAVTELAYIVPQGVMHLQVEIAGNTGQAVTGEAYLSELTDFQTA